MTYIEIIKERRGKIIFYVGDVFLRIGTHAPWIIGVYVLFIVAIIRFSRKTLFGYEQVKKGFDYEIDKIHFKFSLMIYKYKNEIYDAENTVKMLYANKQKILQEEHPSYWNNLSLIKQDVLYLEQILKTKLVSDDQRVKIDELHDFGKKSRRMYVGLMSFVGFLTLGIAFFFSKKISL